jgi:D-xylose transport system substrate-binding protein
MARPRTRPAGPARILLAALTLALATGLLGGCEATRSFAVVLLADRSQGQWESVDLPAFEERVAQRCDGCEVEIRSADGDADEQAAQLDAALEDGADLVVIDPVDAAAAEELVVRAGSVPVLAWSTPVAGADLFVGTDPTAVADLLATEVRQRVDAAGGRSRGVLAVRPPGSAGAALLDTVTGALPRGVALDEVEAGPEGAAQVVREADPTAYAVVLAPTDALAADVAGVLDGERAPALVAPGAGRDTARRIVGGTQSASVHEPRAAMAEQVADATIAWLVGDAPPEPTGELEGVDALVAEPRPVEVDNLAEVMVRSGAVTIDGLCSGETRRRCEELGLF